MGLTPHQLKLLKYIDDYIKEHGYSPSYDDAIAHLGLASKSGIHRLVEGLEERGYIRRIPNKSRSIEVLKTPQINSIVPIGIYADEFGEVRVMGVVEGWVMYRRKGAMPSLKIAKDFNEKFTRK